MPNEPYSQSDRRFCESFEDARVDQPLPAELVEPPSSELLDAVLRETIGNMTDIEAHELITGWIAEHSAGKELHLDVIRSLVHYLLRQRFRGFTFDQTHLTSVARWLWDDPAARARLQLLWGEAGQQ
jgi:hypothetical protein